MPLIDEVELTLTTNSAARNGLHSSDSSTDLEEDDDETNFLLNGSKRKLNQTDRSIQFK